MTTSTYLEALTGAEFTAFAIEAHSKLADADILIENAADDLDLPGDDFLTMWNYRKACAAVAEDVDKIVHS